VETLDLQEGGRLIGIALPHNIARALGELKVATLVPSGTPGEYDVGNIRKVGTVVVGGVAVRIYPKTPIRRLFALLGYARDPAALWRDDNVGLDADVDLYSAVAHGFARSLEFAIGGGLLRGYVVKDEALPVVRGRWRITDQITRRAAQPLPLEVSYDDYIEDIPENQLIKSAALRLLRLPDLAPRASASLRRSLRVLDGVTTLNPGARLPATPPSRANVRYQNALVLARLVLSDASLEHRAGLAIGSGFLVDLWTVFEDFVGATLVRALGLRGGVASLQYSAVLDSAARIEIAPDLVLTFGDRVAACVDLKYKIEQNGSFPNADVYQMVSYCTRFGLDTGHLVYAAGESEPSRIDVIDGPTIYQHALDLGAPFEQVLDQIDRIAAHVFDHMRSRALDSATPISSESTSV
jgi:5-methylcytosine-specific restriction enzyme subunit McrC